MHTKIYWYLTALLTACIFLAGGVQSVLAAPAAPIDHTLTQPDGSTFLARQWGDEWRNGFMTLPGNLILKDEDGWWVYAQAGLDGTLKPALVDGQRLLVGVDLPLRLPPIAGQLGNPQPEPTITTQASLQMENSGTHKVLVLLASFSDQTNTYPAATFQSAIFGAAGSVRDFYLKASFNQLTLAPAVESYGTAEDGVVGWLNLGYDHPNTGDDTNLDNKYITRDALIAADPYVNYSSFDTNGDGYISLTELHIVVVVAGYECSYNCYYPPSIWAHRWTLDGIPSTILDGKILGSGVFNGGYAQFGEIHGDHPATIGIMAHELGHDLSWPDLYDVDDSSAGVGRWSIMGYGSWNRASTSDFPGSSPALPDAWLKWYQGWITPLSVDTNLTMRSIRQAETYPDALLLGINPSGVDWEFEAHSGSGEYFLVENRQQTGYDAGLPGCGLLIWHIDETRTYTNYTNANEARPLVKLLQADGLDELRTKIDYGDAGDPYPGSSLKMTLNSISNPSSRLYSGVDSQVVGMNISPACSESMTAIFSYPAITEIWEFNLPFLTTSKLETLWEQSLSLVETRLFADQNFESSYDAYDIYLADDFIVGGAGWKVDEIYIPGNLSLVGSSLMNATQLVFQIYADDGGKPAGNPVSGGEIWKLSVSPSDAHIQLSAGIDGLMSNVRLKLSTLIDLPPGHYWLVFYPSLAYDLYGQYGRHVSDTLNGYDALVINPLGGFGFPTVWTSIQNPLTWSLTQQDLAFKLSGYR